MLFSFSSSVKEQIGHFQKRKKQHELFHVIIFEILQALSSGSMYNITLQAALPQNCSWSILYGKVMCSKRAMTQAVAFLILCLAACNERRRVQQHFIIRVWCFSEQMLSDVAPVSARGEFSPASSNC